MAPLCVLLRAQGFPHADRRVEGQFLAVLQRSSNNIALYESAHRPTPFRLLLADTEAQIQ